jgi:hypothetical protein
MTRLWETRNGGRILMGNIYFRDQVGGGRIALRCKGDRLWIWEVDASGSESCLVLSFVISSVEPSDSVNWWF